MYYVSWENTILALRYCVNEMQEFERVKVFLAGQNWSLWRSNAACDLKTVSKMDLCHLLLLRPRSDINRSESYNEYVYQWTSQNTVDPHRLWFCCWQWAESCPLTFRPFFRNPSLLVLLSQNWGSIFSGHRIEEISEQCSFAVDVIELARLDVRVLLFSNLT